MKHKITYKNLNKTFTECKYKLPDSAELCLVWEIVPSTLSPPCQTYSYTQTTSEQLSDKDEKSHNQKHTHVLRPFFRDYPGEPTRKVKPMWILLKQETVSGRQTETTPAPHHSVFLQAGCPSCHPTNSFKASKAQSWCLHPRAPQSPQLTCSLLERRRVGHGNEITT